MSWDLQTTNWIAQWASKSCNCKMGTMGLQCTIGSKEAW
jgi:hypothetical protein